MNFDVYKGVNIKYIRYFTKGFYFFPNGTIYLPCWLKNSDDTFRAAYIQHEYGHHLQYSKNKWRFILIAIKSMTSAFFSKEHNRKPYEREANALACAYFGKNSEIAKLSHVFPV